MSQKKKVLQAVKSKYCPDPQSKKEIRSVYEKADEIIQEEYQKETLMVGSSARNTFVEGSGDVDIFVLFDRQEEEEILEKEGLKIGKNVFKTLGEPYHTEYAEHPYVQGQIDGKDVEIVPCHESSRDQNIKSSVDRTPHHTSWIKQNLSDSHREDVVAFKQLLKANGLYGSDLQTQGFSGYLCELLILEKDGFWNLMDYLSQINGKETLTPGNRPPQKSFSSNFVVVDPVDSSRNVASVLSKQNLMKSSLLAHEISEKPRIELFSSRTPEKDEVVSELERRQDVFTFGFSRPDEVSDVLGPQLQKTVRKIKRRITESGFNLVRIDYWLGEKNIRIVAESNSGTSSHKKTSGPGIQVKKPHLDAFISSHDRCYVDRDGELAAVEKRETKSLEHAFKNFIARDDNGIPEKINKAMEKGQQQSPAKGPEDWFLFLEGFLQINKVWQN